MKVDKLLIQECPAAFADFAAKHNAVVYLLRSMRGENGITVAIADANIIISTTGGGSGSSITYTTVSLTVCNGGTASSVTFITSVGLV